MTQLNKQRQHTVTPEVTDTLLEPIISWQNTTILQPFYSIHQLVGIFGTCARLLGRQLLLAGWTRKRTYRVNQPFARWWVPPR